jgi:hypothetical protein
LIEAVMLERRARVTRQARKLFREGQSHCPRE